MTIQYAGFDDPSSWSAGRTFWADAQSWATGPWFIPGPAQRWPVPVQSTQYKSAGPDPLIANRYWAIEGEIQDEVNLVAQANAEGAPVGVVGTMGGPLELIGNVIGGVFGIVGGRQQVKTAEAQAKVAENQLKASLAEAGAVVEQSKALVEVEREKTDRFTRLALIGGAVALGVVTLRAALKKGKR